MLRIGTVPYLVARPLVEGLAEEPGVRLTSATPEALARGLAQGELDLALASSILALERPDFQLWEEGPVIATQGPVRSVVLFLRPGLDTPEDIRRVVLDPRSRSGQELTRIVLRDLHPAPWESLEPPEGTDPFASGADAVQLIGDPALRARISHPDWRILDLGEAWFALTGLPFVFAAWIGRPGFHPVRAERSLRAAAARGLARLPEYAALPFPGGLEPAFLRQYLCEDLCYELPAARIRAALEEFRNRSRAASVVQVPAGESGNRTASED